MCCVPDDDRLMVDFPKRNGRSSLNPVSIVSCSGFASIVDPLSSMNMTLSRAETPFKNPLSPY